MNVLTKQPAPPPVASSTTVPKPQQQAKPTEKKRRPPKPGVLRFSPTAWAKLLYFRDRGDTEIGGFGITPVDDLLYVEDFKTVTQGVSVVTVAFDDQAVADFFDSQVDAGRQPMQFARIWCHTHPGNSPQPSGTDEETFHRVFNGCQHAIMFILAQDGKTYCRLRFNVGPGGSMILPVEVDYSKPFVASDVAAWEAEYRANINPELSFGKEFGFSSQLDDPFDRLYGPLAKEPSGCFPEDWLEALEEMEPAERQHILDELAARPDLWGQQEVTSESY